MEPDHAQRSSAVRVPSSFIKRTVDDGGLGFIRVEVASRQITYANPRFCAMIGYSLYEILDRRLTFTDITHPDDVERSERLFESLAGGDVDTYEIEKRYVLGEETVLPIRGTVAVYDRGAGDQARIAMAVVRDLSEPVPTSGCARGEAHRRGVYFWTHNIRTGRRSCSDGFRVLLGLAPDGPVPSFEDYLSRVHPDDRRRVIDKANRAAKGTLQFGEHRIVRPTGEIRWVSHTVKPIFDSCGAVIEIVGTCLDFTDTRLDPSCSGGTVRTVKNYVDAHWDQPLTVEMLAKAADVNPRTLFKHCKRSLGLTPLEYVKSVRLKNARAMLQTADLSTTVLGIALKCGFQNQGHFARDYRLAFGERPSETLARRRQFLKMRPAETA